jgi:phage shock protein C
MYCQHCGKAFAPETNFCSACGKAAAQTLPPTAYARIVRPRQPRLLAGVCSGFALHYGWDVAVTRILFVILTIFTFPICVFVYIALWLMLPDAQYLLPANTVQPLR